jgi:hypothetical protein
MVYGLPVVWHQNNWVKFPDLGLKIGNYDLVFWVSKSSRQFLDLCLKTKRALVYWFPHKTNGRMKTAHGNVFQANFSCAQSSMKCLISQSSSELWKWHRRLGHLSFDLLYRLSGLGLL